MGVYLTTSVLRPNDTLQSEQGCFGSALHLLTLDVALDVSSSAPLLAMHLELNLHVAEPSAGSLPR